MADDTATDDADDDSNVGSLASTDTGATKDQWIGFDVLLVPIGIVGSASILFLPREPRGKPIGTVPKFHPSTRLLKTISISFAFLSFCGSATKIGGIPPNPPSRFASSAQNPDWAKHPAPNQFQSVFSRVEGRKSIGIFEWYTRIERVDRKAIQLGP